MSLRYAILGLLNKYPLSGYDIAKIVDHGLKHYWATEHTQIYRMLASLKKRKLIDSKIVYQTGKPNKKVYKITASGEKDLRQWLMEPQPLPEIRHSQLLQLSFMADLDIGSIINFLKNYEEFLLKKLALITDPDHIRKTNSIATSDKEIKLWRLILENGIQFYKNEIKWIRKSIKSLEDLDKSDT